MVASVTELLGVEAASPLLLLWGQNTLRNSKPFFGGGLYVSLAGDATGSSLHCDEVNETRILGGGNREGVQVHSLPATSIPHNLGNDPTRLTS